jgi:hypothetical protein
MICVQTTEYSISRFTDSLTPPHVPHQSIDKQIGIASNFFYSVGRIGKYQGRLLLAGIPGEAVTHAAESNGGCREVGPLIDVEDGGQRVASLTIVPH